MKERKRRKTKASIDQDDKTRKIKKTSKKKYISLSKPSIFLDNLSQEKFSSSKIVQFQKSVNLNIKNNKSKFHLAISVNQAS